jgi:predicted PurR-regulated permease PerM
MNRPTSEEVQISQPLPRAHVWLLAGILIVLLFFALYFARTVIVPILFAVLLYLLLQPPMRFLVRQRLPRTLAAVLLIVALCGGVGGATVALSGPAAAWLERAPQSMNRLEERLRAVKLTAAKLQRATDQVEKMAATDTPGERPVAVKGPGLGGALLDGTRNALAGIFSAIVLLFFLLLAGDQFLRRLVEIVPTLTDKKQAVEIARETERNVSAYLATITMMNAGVGVATALACWASGLPSPLLWGGLTFLLNYAPILGPLVAVAVIFMAGLVEFNSTAEALVPAGLYFAIHIVEGQSLTPMLLAKRFLMNPVVVIVALLFWYWMWGIPGVLLAVPMLAAFKIVCDHVSALTPLGHFLSATPPAEG